jgi:hypothetical protein
MEKNPGLSKEILGPLWDRIPDMPVPVKGDMVYLFGELGDEQWITRLKGLLLEETHRELIDAVNESIERLTSPR